MNRRIQLRELRDVAQADNGLLKRWFSSDEGDLFTWQSGDNIQRFEFCYGKPRNEYSLRWDSNQGYEFSRIDNGESGDTHKQSPVLIGAERPDPAKIIATFNELSANLDDKTRAFVLKQLNVL